MKFEVILLNGKAWRGELTSGEMKGKFLIGKIFHNVGLAGPSSVYFGVCYSDHIDCRMTWVAPDDNMNVLKSNGIKQFQMAVRFYPKHPDLVLTNELSRLLFRQHMKSMLLNCELGCETKVHALLDSYIAQAELGDVIDEPDASYLKRTSRVEVCAPTFLTAGTPILETDYMKLVRSYHRKHKGMTSAQADIRFLNTIQKVPMYGYTLHKVYKEKHNDLHIGLCEEGLHFLYEDITEKFLSPKEKECFLWNQLVFCELKGHKIKLGFLQESVVSEHSIKVCSRQSLKGAERLEGDIIAHKQLYVDQVDGHDFFNSRKKAERCYTASMSRHRGNSLGRGLSYIRNSLRKPKRSKTLPKNTARPTGIVNELRPPVEATDTFMI